MKAFIAADGDGGIFKFVHQRQQPLGRNGSRTGNFHFRFDTRNDTDFQIRGSQSNQIVLGFDQNIAENRQGIAAADGIVDPLQRFEQFFAAYSKFHNSLPLFCKSVDAW